MSGALAFIDHAGRPVAHKTHSTPPLEAIRDALAGCNPAEAIIYLEKVGGFIAGKSLPGSSMFKMGENFGIWQGLAMALGVRLVLVRPQDWQAGISGTTGKKGAERKRALHAEAVRRFPNFKVTLDNCDALLIADFARRVEG